MIRRLLKVQLTVLVALHAVAARLRVCFRCSLQSCDSAEARARVVFGLLLEIAIHHGCMVLSVVCVEETTSKIVEGFLRHRRQHGPCAPI